MIASSRSHPRTTIWLPMALLVSLVSAGCAVGIDPAASPVASQPPKSLPPAACGAPAPRPGSGQQYLYAGAAGGTWGFPLLWVFKVDAATGALTEMPWSPMETFNAPLSGTMDPRQKYFYVSSRAPFGLDHQPIVTMETYEIPSDDSRPRSRGYVESSSSDLLLQFDPQGRFFYELPRSGVGELFPWQVGPDGTPVRGGPAIPLNVAWPTTYAYKTEGNLVLVAHGTDDRAGIAVYREDCASGQLTLLKDNNCATGLDCVVFDAPPSPMTYGPNFLAAPAQGDLVVGWYCFGFGTPFYQFRVDPVTGTMTEISGSRLKSVCETSFDRSGQYAVARMDRLGEGSDAIIIFRVDPDRGLVETDRFVLPLHGRDSQRIIGDPQFDLSGSFIFASSTHHLVALRLDRGTGKATPVPGFPELRVNFFNWLFIVAR